MVNRTYIDTVKKYFWFSKEEQKSLIVIALVFGFMLSFNRWGDETFNVAVGLVNFAIATLIAAAGLFIHEAGQRLYAIKHGFKTEVKLWWYGLAIGLLVCIISRGNILIFAATGMWIHQMSFHRVGKFRYGPTIEAFGTIALAGPVANIIAATIVKVMQVNLHLIPANSVIANSFFMFNWLLAVYSLIPIPPLDGSRLLFYSRLTYSFIFGTIAGYVILALMGIYSYFLAFVIGGLVWLTYYMFFESKF